MSVPNSVALTRSRRPNAGSKMSRLLNEEEEDEFYTNVYGGFTEEADDIDYESESSASDTIDSDFVDSEKENGDEAGGAGSDEEESKKRRTNRVITKSYKEPKKTKPKDAESSTEVKLEKAAKAKSAQQSESNFAEQLQQQPSTGGRKLRASTVKASESVVASSSSSSRKRSSSAGDGRDQEAGAGSASSSTLMRKKALLAEIAQRKNVSEVRRLTQEELLAEAKITEEINKRSLARYQRLEVERKKIRVHKQVSQQPMIRVHSFAIPCLDDQPVVYGAAVNTQTGDMELTKMLVDRDAKCSRTLVSFTDNISFTTTFPSVVAKHQQQPSSSSAQANRQGPRKRTRFCPLTGRVARYLDPLTRTPYADLAAFRALRYLYRIHLETGQPAIDLLRQYRSGELHIVET